MLLYDYLGRILMQMFIEDLIDNNKLMYFIETEEDIDAIIKEAKKTKFREKLEVILELNFYDASLLEKVRAQILPLKDKTKISISINNDKLNMRINDMPLYFKYAKVLENDNIPLFIREDNSHFTLDEALNAQKQIEDLTTRIKNANLSPFEQFLAIYTFLTEREYKRNDNDYYSSVNIFSILNGENIVCLGYANIMKRLCDELGIQCIVQTCELKTPGKPSSLHANNVVIINDDKYNIHGCFYADACWDCKNSKKDIPRTLNYCLIPLADKNKFRRLSVDIEGSLQCLYSKDFSNFDKYANINQVISDLNLNIKNVPHEHLTEELFCDPSKIQRACDRFSALFNKYNIPLDIYNSGNDNHFRFIPQVCDYKYIFANLMQDNIDEKRLEHSISQLNHYYKNKNNDIWANTQTYNTSIECFDDYNMFLQLINQPNYINHLKTNALYTDISSFDINEWINWCSLCDETTSFYNAIQTNQHIEKEFSKMFGIDADPIPLNSYKQALTEAYLALGIDEKHVKTEVYDVLNSTISMTSTIFKKSAINTFNDFFNNIPQK